MEQLADEVQLPGFRFHPTDEELVGFYLAKKVDRKPIGNGIDSLVRHVDIYKHDPWDLPKANDEAGDKECLYFFCKRGKKYSNSVRPNRVTGTGFWKATGIDKPVYDGPVEGDINGTVIGLKKTLVYYHGSAGKGTKTDWMMHEFRLPPTSSLDHDNSPDAATNPAEVWTVCKIFKRDIVQKRYMSGRREPATNNKQIQLNQIPFQDIAESEFDEKQGMGSADCYISFGCPSGAMAPPDHGPAYAASNIIMGAAEGQSSMADASCSSISCFSPADHGLAYDDWDELRSVVGFALDPSSAHHNSE